MQTFDQQKDATSKVAERMLPIRLKDARAAFKIMRDFQNAHPDSFNVNAFAVYDAVWKAYETAVKEIIEQGKTDSCFQAFKQAKLDFLQKCRNVAYPNDTLLTPDEYQQYYDILHDMVSLRFNWVTSAIDFMPTPSVLITHSATPGAKTAPHVFR